MIASHPLSTGLHLPPIMGMFRIEVPERVVRRMEDFVNKSGLYPNPCALMSESASRFSVSLRSWDSRALDDAIAEFGEEIWGRNVKMDVTMPNSVYNELERISEARGVNLFALAVLVQMDRLYGIS